MNDQTITCECSDRIETAIRLAREDGEAIRKDLASLQANIGDPENGFLVVDGSAYSPSWRALAGGAQVWRMARNAAGESPHIEAYVEELDRITDALGLYWEDGCLWRADDDQEAIDAALGDCQMWDNLPESAKDYYRQAAREDSENPI